MPFKEGKSGNPIGRTKGSHNKVTKEFRETLATIIEGQSDTITEKFAELAKEKPKIYLDVLAKFLPFVAPKMTETDITSGGEHIPIESWVTFKKSES